MSKLLIICLLAAGTSAVPTPQFRGIIGNSGIVRPDGKNVQFTQEQADNFLLVGPSGIVTKDGRNIQITENMELVQRSKRSAGSVSNKGIIGHSGILRADGSVDTFDHDTAHNILLIGPAGIVTRDGQNMQLTDDLRIIGRSKRSSGFVSAKGNIGHSGILRADGSTDLFDHDTAHNILLIGPSGIVTRDGKNIQLTDDLKIVRRSKRQAGYVSAQGNIGHSGILRADGSTDLFDHDTAHNILLIGPSGIVTKDGKNMQLTEDLKIASSRTKRHVIGESGMILDDGQQIQFKTGGVKILLEGPSGILMSDGTLIQKRA
ncbi:hypothetical protein SK128_001514 [Halocaridina rubra]|uniref:Uncharacterized protein n=1 Tax=Halocaridina rubra TaxID=373956 RepID=A0AAN9A706_HALRR